MKTVFCGQHKEKCGFGQDYSGMVIVNREWINIGFLYEEREYLSRRSYKNFIV